MLLFPQLFFVFMMTLLSPSTSLLVNQTYTYQFPQGNFTEILSANDDDPELTDKPSNYFVCGFQTRSLKWSKMMKNCDCKYGFVGSKIEWVCKECINEFQSKTSEIHLIFCDYEDWSNQKIRGHESNSPNKGDLRKAVMCPRNTFASGISVDTGKQYGEQLGLTNLIFFCPTVYMVNGTRVHDEIVLNQTKLYTAKKGRFMSGFSIKVAKDGSVTGFKANFESIPIVKQITYKYYGVPAVSAKPILFQNIILTNCGKQTGQQTAKFSKSKQYTERWISDQKFINGMKLSKKAQKAVRPSAPTNQTSNDSSDSSGYKTTTQSMSFTKEVTTTLSSDQSIRYPVPPMSQLSITTVIREQEAEIRYIATVTIVDLNTGALIRTYEIQGTWQGVLISEISTKINTDAAKCNNLRL